MTTNILVGDTIRVKVTFRDWSSIGDGEVINPDRVVVDLLDEDFNRTPNIEEAINLEPGVYYFDWTPLNEGIWYIEFVGKFYEIMPPTWQESATPGSYLPGDIVFYNEKYFIATANYIDGDEPESATPNGSWEETDPPAKTRSVVREKFEVQKFETGSIHSGASLGEDQEFVFTTILRPLYIDPEELLHFYPESNNVEVMELISRYSREVAKILGIDPDEQEPELSFLAFEYIRAAVLCALSRIHDYTFGGDASSLSLGDLKISNQSYPRERITRANAASWCELAAILRDELLRGEANIKAVVKGTSYTNPMPKRELKSYYGGNGRRSF